MCADRADFVAQAWDRDVLPALEDYIRIPAKSPAFDPDWKEHGHLHRAAELLRQWSAQRDIEGLIVEIVEIEGRTPVLLVEVPATAASEETVLLYGHLDKQPEMLGWRPGLGPWEPVRDGELLYGRGGADDGYSTFAALTAIEAVQRAGAGHARCVVLIEGSEESGSPDLPAYVDHLAPRLGAVGLVVCLDSFCGTYDRLWSTTSLRGLLNLTVRVALLEEGVHSGATGMLPSSFRVARRLLERVEDAATGRIVLDDLHVDVPPERVDEARHAAEVLGESLLGDSPLLPGVQPAADDPTELLLASTWRPALEVVGADGLPAVTDAGNVLRAETALKLSFRLPPVTALEPAREAITEALTADPPYGAHVEVSAVEAAPGWAAPPTAGWLADAVAAASEAWYGAPPGAVGVGGSIPFMAMLGERFPDAQYLVAGVLGPGSNAHGPNEFLHVPSGVRLTGCVAHVLAAHAARPQAS